MINKKYISISFLVLLFLAASANAQSILDLNPYNGQPETFLMTQIKADTAATGGLLADRVYRLQRGGIYLNTEIFNVDSGKTVRFISSDGDERMPVVFQYPTGTGATPHRPPGNLFVLRGGDLEMTNIIVAGYFEPVDSNINNVQGGLINTTQPGCTIILHGCILTNINGQHIRTGSATEKVEVKDCIFANMGALTSSNLGAGKGLDLREASCDSLILVNNTFVNSQDRVIRHYNFGNPLAGTGEIGYCLIDHNTFVNGMGFHGLFSLGNVGEKVIITNNLFVDAFALGEDEDEPKATRSAEWANTGETYENGNNRQTWIYTAPNDITEWTISNNYFAISDSGKAFLNADTLKKGSPLSWHINSKLGADSVNAFTEIDVSMVNIPKLMTNLMRWYRSPSGGDFSKNTPDATRFHYETDDYDRRGYRYYSDSLDASYSRTSDAFFGGVGRYPAGDLNWFPDKKAEWADGVEQFAMTIDAEKDEFYNALEGPDDGYLQIRSYAFNGNGRPENDADLSAKVWTAWDDQYFYLYEEVMDDTVSANHPANVYEEDVLELKVDPQATDSANSVWATNFTALGEGEGVLKFDNLSNVSASQKQYARKLIEGGYALELAIKWPAITFSAETITPEVGNIFGMAINQHDNDGSARRQASIMWAAEMNDLVWSTSKMHGTVKFLADNKLQFIPQSPTTPWRVNIIPYDGSDYTPVGVDGSEIIPYEFAMKQNYPNPFNPSTKIFFTLKEPGFTTLSIYNILGQKVATLVSKELTSGQHSVDFNAVNLSSGVYLYKLESAGNVSTMKMTLMK